VALRSVVSVHPASSIQNYRHTEILRKRKQSDHRLRIGIDQLGGGYHDWGSVPGNHWFVDKPFVGRRFVERQLVGKHRFDAVW